MKIYIKKTISSQLKKIPLIDRWLIGSLLPTLIFFTLGFTVFSISLGLLFDLIQKIFATPLTILGSLKIIFFKLPKFFVISLPMSCLLTNLSIFSRLRENNELIALKALGFNLRRFLLSSFIIGIITTLITFSLNNILVPTTNKLSELTLRQELGVTNDIKLSTDIQFSDFSSEFNKNGNYAKLKHLFHARVYENNEMRNVTLIDYSNSDLIKIISAKRGIYKEEKNQWYFYDGQVVEQSKFEKNEVDQKSFTTYILPKDILGIGPINIANIPKDSNNMSLFYALKARKLYKSSGNIKELRRINVRINEKFTFPIVCLIFSLMGAIIGASKKLSTTQSQSFGLSILIIIFYYFLAFIFSSMGVSGLLNPVISAWTPLLITFSCSEVLIRRYS